MAYFVPVPAAKLPRAYLPYQVPAAQVWYPPPPPEPVYYYVEPSYVTPEPVFYQAPARYVYVPPPPTTYLCPYCRTILYWVPNDWYCPYHGKISKTRFRFI
ncbi:MAG: hypothetical protein QW371_03530 [Candidatus Bathyarchaeia archaeon]